MRAAEVHAPRRGCRTAGEGRQTRARLGRFLRGRLARYVRAAAASVHHNHYVRLLGHSAGAGRRQNAPPPPTPGVVRFLLGDNCVTARFLLAFPS